MGAYMSARASGTLGQVEGVSPTASFLGGFFLFIGVRLGGGCTRYSQPLFVCKMYKLVFCFYFLPCNTSYGPVSVSVCHKPVLYRNDWMIQAGIWRGGVLPPILHCTIKNSGTSRNEGAPIWNFVLCAVIYI